MSILNYMVTKEATVNPALLEGATQENLHDRVGAFSGAHSHATIPFTAPQGVAVRGMEPKCCQ